MSGQIANDHYRIIAREIASGRVVPFLGPSTKMYGRLERLILESSGWLPSGVEPSNYLLKMLPHESTNDNDLSGIVQYIPLTVGTYPLYAELRRLIADDHAMNGLHRFLANPPISYHQYYREGFSIIVTTGRDDLLEQAFLDADKPFDVVSYVVQGEHQGKFIHRPHGEKPRVIFEPNVYMDLSPNHTVILNMSGTPDQTTDNADVFAATREDYFDYLFRTDVSKLFPVTLVAGLRRSHCLFLGYTLRNRFLRLLLSRLWGDNRLRADSWAVQPSPHRVDEDLWNSRGVTVLHTTLENYIDKLSDALRALQARPESPDN
jgi:hypothetical protein